MTNDNGYWPVPYLRPVLDHGLPTGCLTLIELGAAGIRHQSCAAGLQAWTVGVKRLVDALAGQGKAVLYVSCGGAEPGAAQAVAASSRSRLVQGFDDEDLTVFAPSGHLTITGTPWPAYECRVPTLNRIEAALASLEAAQGPAALLLDDLSMARPFWAACEDDEELGLPDGFRLSRAQADGWRAEQVMATAQARPDAPTVVVWHTRGDDAGLEALRALASTRLVLTEDVPGNVEVSGSARQSVLAPPPPARTMFLP